MNFLSDADLNKPSTGSKTVTPYWSVRTLLTCLVFACLLPGIVGAAAFFVREYRQGEARTKGDTIQMARALMQAVDNQILQAQALARGLATANSLLKRDFAAFHQQARLALEQSGLGATAILVDPSGQEILNTAKEFGNPLLAYENQEIVQGVLTTGTPAISNLYMDSVLGRPAVAVAVPVLRDGNVAHVIVLCVLPTKFNSILTAQGLPSGWLVTILDGTSTIVTRSREAERFIGQKPAEPFARRFLSSSEGTVEGVMKDGVPVRAAFARSPATNWVVAVSVHKEVLNTHLIRSLVLLALGVASMFAVSSGIAWIIGGKVARSFQALTAPALALGAGEKFVPPSVEVEEAAEVTKAMSEAARLLDERGAALLQSEERYRTLFETMNEAFAICEIILDEQGQPSDYRHLLVNPAFERIGGFAAGEVNGKTARELVHFVEPYWVEMFGRVALTGEHESREDYTSALDKWLFARAFSLGGGKFAYLFSDVTDRKLAQEHVRQAALHDPLTGLPNRALIFEYGTRLIAGAMRHHGRGALLFIDLDRFKPINDVYGHEVGDRVLQEVGKRLLACTRNEDLVGRLGGDEFVVIVPNLETDRRRAAVVAQHVMDSISQPFQINDLGLSISPSVGISNFPDHATDIGALIHTADMAMYHAKKAGRGNYQFYTPAFDRRAEQALMLEVRLKNAIKHGKLELHYQPVIDIRNGKLIGAEALVRLADDGDSSVTPDKFIPIAEATGLIGDLGEWVAVEACRQHKAWLCEGLALTIAINVSPIQLRQPQFAEKLSSIIAATGIDPSRLEIEVTESAVMENVTEAITILNNIKSLGVKIALDDFGTGYSSLSTLTSLPLDKLKVDQSFVRKIERDMASRAVTQAVIALGNSLKLEVHGEGIESEKALHYLQELGCTQAQGYLFSAPLPACKFAQWCVEQQPA